MAQLIKLDEVWDHLYDLLSNDSTLVDVNTWSQEIDMSVPDVAREEDSTFPIVVVHYSRQGIVRTLMPIGAGGLEKEVTLIYVSACCTHASNYTVTKNVLNLIERIVLVLQTNRSLSYDDDTAAIFCRIENVVTRTIRSSLDKDVWYGQAAVQLGLINEPFRS